MAVLIGSYASAFKFKMLIYPDSSDLINLCRGTAWLDISEIARRLIAHSHLIVLSINTLTELSSDPLRNGHSLEVRRDLNRLEELPLTFVNEARIYDMEIREAVRAFDEAREYKFDAITPFASRLADTIDIRGNPLYIVQGGRRVSTAMIVNFRIAEVIDYLWKFDSQMFDIHRRLENDWILVMQNDRSMTNPPRLRDHFVTMMIRALGKHRIRPPAPALSRLRVGCISRPYGVRVLG